jgi:plastocyanin
MSRHVVLKVTTLLPYHTLSVENIPGNRAIICVVECAMKKLSLVAAVLLISMSGSFAATWRVRVADFAFTPATLNVAVGDVIIWRWQSGMHTTTSLTVPPGARPWNRPIDSTNTIFRYRVRVAGTYTYQCNFHAAQMQGTINATGGNPAATH